MNYLSCIGFNGPINLLILILVMFSTTTQSHNIYLYIYVIVWQAINQLINIVIKNTLKYPRPNNYENTNFKNLTPALDNYFSIHRNFGMPSGHAQQVISELTFIIFYFKNPIITTISILQSCITLWQRYSTHSHSINQLVVGSAIGLIVGIAFYKILPSIIK